MMLLFKNVTIFAMASLAETRDNETGNHIKRTSNYVKMLAKNYKIIQNLKLILLMK